MFLSLNYTIFLYNSYNKSLTVVISGAKLRPFWEEICFKTVKICKSNDFLRTFMTEKSGNVWICYFEIANRGVFGDSLSQEGELCISIL